MMRSILLVWCQKSYLCSRTCGTPSSISLSSMCADAEIVATIDSVRGLPFSVEDVRKWTDKYKVAQGHCIEHLFDDATQRAERCASDV